MNADLSGNLPLATTATQSPHESESYPTSLDSGGLCSFESLLSAAPACAGVFESNAGASCGSFCAQVRRVAEERQNCVFFARRWHILGRWAAKIFDDIRGESQGPEHINQLFQKKTCEGVLQSADKSNPTVNTFCSISAGVAVLAAFAAFAQVTGDMAIEQNLHKD
eukprot:g6823.t1